MTIAAGAIQAFWVLPGTLQTPRWIPESCNVPCSLLAGDERVAESLFLSWLIDVQQTKLSGKELFPWDKLEWLLPCWGCNCLVADPNYKVWGHSRSNSQGKSWPTELCSSVMLHSMKKQQWAPDSHWRHYQRLLREFTGHLPLWWALFSKCLDIICWLSRHNIAFSISAAFPLANPTEKSSVCPISITLAPHFPLSIPMATLSPPMPTLAVKYLKDQHSRNYNSIVRF